MIILILMLRHLNTLFLFQILYFKTENNLRLIYNADTAGGDSGGPVYVNESFVGTISGVKVSYDYNTVIAIHTRGDNSGVRINFDIMYFCYQNSYLTAS